MSIGAGMTAMGNFYDREISYRFAERRTAEMTATDKTSAGMTPWNGALVFKAEITLGVSETDAFRNGPQCRLVIGVFAVLHPFSQQLAEYAA